MNPLRILVTLTLSLLPSMSVMAAPNEVVDARPTTVDTVGIHHQNLFQFDRPLKAVDVVLPHLLQVNPFSLTSLQVIGLERGQTDMRVTYQDGDVELIHIEVVDEPTSPQALGWSDVGVGRMLIARGPKPSAVSVSNPEIIEVVPLKNDAIVFKGQAEGTTDVVMYRDGKPVVYAIHVGAGERSQKGMERLDTTTVRMVVGSTYSPPSSKNVRVVQTVRPDIVGVSPRSGLLAFDAFQVGTTDILAMDHNGRIEGWTLEVEP